MDYETFEKAKSLNDLYWAYDGMRWFLSELDNPNPKALEVPIKCLRKIAEDRESANRLIAFLEEEKKRLTEEFEGL